MATRQNSTKPRTAPRASTVSKRAAAKPARRHRTSQLIGIASVAAAAVAIGAGIFEVARRMLAPGNAEHDAPDLALDQPHPGPNDRAPDAFRPDPTAEVPESEREGLRPATGPAPSLVRDDAADLDTIH
ncbi:hypothetical protein TPR58_18930 [Sphingomonas sp. HF-S3]|uniref:Conjugal transfer protein TrbI n=1 Tax=Sphingomonas rustica TaxID=3103142 RepID=A0ABV0BEP6_9SPHN